MPIPKKFLPLIVAGVLGLIATFLINSYLQQQSEQARQRAIAGQKSLVTVILAKQDIAANVALTENMLKEEVLPKNIAQPRAATSIDRVAGRVSLAPIAKGEQVLLNKIALSGQEVTLSSKIPRGKRAITVSIDNISSVGGMIRPGDHADIVGMVPLPAMTPEGKQVSQMTTLPLFQDVLVIAVGQDFSTGGGKREGPSSPAITFALTPQEANIIAFVQEQGRIRLILRSPEDTQTQPVTPASWDTVLRTVMPQAFVEQPKDQQRLPPPTKKVEIYRGTQKEVRNIE